MPRRLKILEVDIFLKSIGWERCFNASEYRRSSDKQNYLCPEKHNNYKTLRDLRHGYGCKICYNKKRGSSQRLTIEDCHELARLNDGIYLSSSYYNNQIPGTWQCNKCLYKWKANYSHIKNGTWCPNCSGKLKLNINICKNYAINKNGICMDEIYINAKVPMNWHCNIDNKNWKNNFDNVKNKNQWCPYCSKSVSTKEVSLFYFVKELAPDSKNRVYGVLPGKFELDIYIPSLKKAIEFDGYRWHHSEWAIAQGVPARDAKKDKLCKEAGIDLLRIRERDWDTRPEFIKEQISKFVKVF